MNFNDNIGFICNNEQDWITCQSILFNLGYDWTVHDYSKYLKFPQHAPGFIILIDKFNNQTIKYISIYRTDIINSRINKIYQINQLIKYHRLEKLKNLNT